MTVGAALLLVNLTAWWEPFDADWMSTTLGVVFVVIGAIVKVGLNLYDEEQSK